MIYTVTLNPALDKTVEIPNFTTDTVNRVTKLRTDPGGKGINVSKVIQALGRESVAMGLLAGNTGRGIEKALREGGLETDFLYIDGETRTNLKVVDPEGHTNTDINEPGPLVPEQALETLLNRLTARIRKGDIVVLAGSLPKGAPADSYARWVRACTAAGAKVFLDADGEKLANGISAGPALIKPNDIELRGLCGQALETREALVEAARALIRGGVGKVVISLGSKGALYVSSEETLYAEGLKVPVGSTVGAGDSVVAALAVAEAEGMSAMEAAVLSTATGAANVMCSGTQAAQMSVIESLMPRVKVQKI